MKPTADYYTGLADLRKKPEPIKPDTIKTLRDRQPLKLYDAHTRMFVTIQLNKKEKAFVCWERWVSSDRKNWVCHNEFLSLKDVRQILNEISYNTRFNREFKRID